MGMQVLLDGLLKASKNLFWAVVYTDGMQSRIRVTYHPGGEVEIHHLPWPGYEHVLLAAESAVFFDRYRKRRLSDQDAQAFQLCRLWDPRALVRSIKDEQELTPGKWRAHYDIDLMALDLHPQQAAWLKTQAAQIREVEFTADDDVLNSMTEEDFSGSLGNKITLGFAHEGRVPTYARPL